jgi:predicted transcriptional regulator
MKIALSLNIRKEYVEALDKLVAQTGKSREALVEDALFDMFEIFQEFTAIDLDLDEHLTEEAKNETMRRIVPEDDAC